MHSFHIPLFIVSLALFPKWAAADYTYWVDPNCAGNVGFMQALQEVIWVSGRLADSIDLKDARLEDPFQWFFGMGVGEVYASKVSGTYRRISQLKRIDDQKTAQLRLMCDDDRRYKLLDGHADYEGIWLDEGNHVYAYGDKRGCKKAELKLFAYTLPHINSVNRELQAPATTQPPERAVITFCQRIFDANTEKKPYTIREFARRDLGSALANLWQIKGLVYKTIFHELVHVPFLSVQDFIFPVDGPQTVKKEVEGGKDRHGKDEIVGYYTKKFPALPGKKLGPEYTVMNCDSYSYVGSLYRLRDKQWEPVFKDGETPQISVKKNTQLELVGDWPGAPPLPDPKARL